MITLCLIIGILYLCMAAVLYFFIIQPDATNIEKTRWAFICFAWPISFFIAFRRSEKRKPVIHDDKHRLLHERNYL